VIKLNRLVKIFFFRLSIFFDKYWTESYSQEGEDMILKRIFEFNENGFYVDVGSHHPKRFSNTYNFYKKGWKGINVDASPDSIETFNKMRSRDINIEAAVSDKPRELIFYRFSEPAINTFNPELAKEHIEAGEELINEIKIKTITLKELLWKYLPTFQEIDFMSIDVEGHDFEVLKSNNWKKYRPKFLLVELLHLSGFEQLTSNEIYKFLIENDYSLLAKTLNTYFFKDNRK